MNVINVQKLISRIKFLPVIATIVNGKDMDRLCLNAQCTAH